MYQSNFGLFACVLLTAGVAIAATCTLSKPWDADVNEEYKVRDIHPVSGATNRPHRGVDMNKPGDVDCDETVALREGCTFETYTQYGGYGNTLIRDCGNGVKELYGHLEGYGTPPNTVQVGRTGGVTGCHLHYEVIIDGVTVDPECVWGTGGTDCPKLGSSANSQANLCDASQREALKQNAEDKLGASANSPVIEGGKAKGGSAAPTQGGSGSNNGGSSGGNNGGSSGGGSSGGGSVPSGYEGDTDAPITTGTHDGTQYNPNQGGGLGDETGIDIPPATPDGPPVTPPPSSDPGSGEVTGCAPDTWNAMTNQAIMEARREVVMNQTFIVKPDSILQYACFDKVLDGVQEKAGPIFSESDYWKNRQVDISGKSAENPKQKVITMDKSLGNNSLDMSIASAVRSAMGQYIKNFDHKMLGGTSTIAQSTTTCDMMKQVWGASKCRNFSGEKVFYTFDELVGNDPRQYPDNMKCDETGITQEMIDIAHNKNFAHAKTTKAKGYGEYLLGEKGCNLTIQTGVTIRRRETQGENSTVKEFPDAVCSNAGCSYNKDNKCQ